MTPEAGGKRTRWRRVQSPSWGGVYFVSFFLATLFSAPPWRPLNVDTSASLRLYGHKTPEALKNKHPSTDYSSILSASSSSFLILLLLSSSSSKEGCCCFACSWKLPAYSWLGVFQRPLTLILLRKYRDTNARPYRDANWWCIYYSLAKCGHTFAKVSR